MDPLGAETWKLEPVIGSSSYKTEESALSLPILWTRFTLYPQIFSISTAKSNWVPVVKAEEVPLYRHRSPQHLISGHHEYEHFPVSSPDIYNDGKKLPFLQENVQAAPASACQPLLKTVSATGLQNNHRKLYDSASALCLLSSPEARSLCDNLCQDAAAGDRIPGGQPLIPAMQCGGLGQFYGSGSEQCFSYRIFMLWN